MVRSQRCVTPAVLSLSVGATCIDPAVFRVLGDASDDHAASLHRLLVEGLHQVVALAVDPRWPQSARVQTFSSCDLKQGKQGRTTNVIDQEFHRLKLVRVC